MTPASDTWRTISAADYPFAGIRLTTLAHARVKYLLFGYVELLPAEIPIPGDYYAKKNFFDDITVSCSLSVMPLTEALSWYEQAAYGNLFVPNLEKHLPVEAVRLGTEPALGHLIAAKETPVEVFWHNAPRMCRLVPMETLQSPVEAFLQQPERSERRNNVCDWLRTHCFIDLTSHPDCAGSIVLLAPNPILRSWNYGPSRVDNNGNEIIKFRSTPREGYDFNSLSIRLHEFRQDGEFSISPVQIDAFEEGEVVAPHKISELALEVSCMERGLLAMTKPHGYFSSISFESHVASANVKVEIPGRTKGAPVTSQTIPMFKRGFTTQVGKPIAPNGASRLAFLLAASSIPAIEARDEQVFIDNRNDAVQFIRGLIGFAKTKVFFVDPYFSFIDLREFALFVNSTRCEIGVLTGRDEPGWRNAVLSEDPPPIHGNQMLANIEHINKIRAENGFSMIEVKVKGASSRKYHDRFLVVDDNIWHLGHSFNALGDGSATAVTKLRKPERVLALIVEDMQRADAFENYWKAQLAAIEQGKEA